jgi:REP element-mobilizing transposase RayT
MARSGHRLRIGRQSISGQIYLITITCHQRRDHFAALPAARCAVLAMKAASEQARTWCFVAMPDHLHWMMQLGDGANLSAAVQRLKSQITRELHRKRLVEGPVWQRGFHDRALRADEDMQTVARYIIANPIRAGLTKSVREFPNWDAAWL